MKNINPIISRMKIDEIDKIIDLQLNNNSNILSKSSIIDDINNENSIYFIAKTDDNIIGYVAAMLLYDHIDILGVLIDNNYTRNGIAFNLLSSVLDYAKSIKIHDILLEVRITNIAAQKLYEKFGFEKINIRKKYYTDNLEDAIIYKLSI